MIDLTAFAIFDVTGPGALDAVQRLAMRQMDVAVGRVVYTPVLTPSGGFRSDLTIMRLDDDVFRVVTGGACGMSDLKWFSDHLPADGLGADPRPDHVVVHARPVGTARARHPRRGHQRRRLATRASRSRAAATIEIGPLQVLASRISYVGDLGWELYVPIEQGARLWDIIAEAGRAARRSSRPGSASTARPAGSRSATAPTAPSSTASTTSSRRGWRGARSRTRTSSASEAHLRHREAEPAAILCTLTVDDHTSTAGVKRYMLGGEPILTRDGEPLIDAKGRRSYVTSAGAGPSIGKHILMSYLPPEHARVGRAAAVEYMGERYPVTVAVVGSTPVFDPENTRVRS